MMNKTLKKGIVLLMLAVVMPAFSGCSNAPDTVGDPLSDFGIEAVLPFQTTAPELAEATPTPMPTPGVDDLITTPQYGQSWKADGTVVNQEPLDTDFSTDDGFLDDDDDFAPVKPKATPKPTAKPSTGYEKLSMGSTGQAVRDLQNRLKKLNYYTGTVDGQYGSGTVTAVRRFQEIMGFEENGVASASLQKEIFSSTAPAYKPSPTPAPTAQYIVLSKGDSGSRVTRLQNRLKTLGYYTGTADGQYGSGTVNAVKRFQKALGLEETGTASVALQKTLFSANAPDYVTPTPTPAEYIRLEAGSSGTRVRQLQARLKALGYFTGTTDGEFGSSTTKSVKRFQLAVGDSQTGVATVALQKKLFAKNAPLYEGEEPEEEYFTLSPGDTGEVVKRLQRRLQELKYFSGDIGGNYLTQTTDAVKKFQKAIGVKETGTATVAVQKRLFASDAPAFKPEPTPAPKYIELRRGDSGPRVQALKDRLIELGYLKESAGSSDVFGSGAEDAVKRFEARYNKPKTGIATVALQNKLFAADALPNKEATPTPEPEPEAEYIKLQQGDTGERVKKLQRRLQKLGYFEGAIGGNYQKLTMDAVKRFQKAVGHKENGVASVALQKLMFADDAPVYEKVTSPADPIYKQLKKGDTGASVKTLQERLLEVGYIKKTSDVKYGTFDNGTLYAVIDAQNARGYDSDGVATVDFLVYLFSDEVWDYALADYVGG